MILNELKNGWNWKWTDEKVVITKNFTDNFSDNFVENFTKSFTIFFTENWKDLGNGYGKRLMIEKK